MSNVTTTRVEFENALDALSLLNDYVHAWMDYDITEVTYGYCCDNGYYENESASKYTLAEVYWAIVNYSRGASGSHDGWWFAIDYVKNERTGNPDTTESITVSILDTDMPEPCNHVYYITPKDE